MEWGGAFTGSGRHRKERKKSYTFQLLSSSKHPPILMSHYPAARPVTHQQLQKKWGDPGVTRLGHQWAPLYSEQITSRISVDSEGSPCWPVTLVSLIPLSAPPSLGRRAKKSSHDSSWEKRRKKNGNHRTNHALQKERTDPPILWWSLWCPHPCLKQQTHRGNNMENSSEYELEGKQDGTRSMHTCLDDPAQGGPLSSVEEVWTITLCSAS